jgi:hypothetical protein
MNAKPESQIFVIPETRTLAIEAKLKGRRNRKLVTCTSYTG